MYFAVYIIVVTIIYLLHLQEYINEEYNPPTHEVKKTTYAQEKSKEEAPYNSQQYGKDPYGRMNNINYNDFYPIIAPKLENTEKKIEYYGIYTSTIILFIIRLLLNKIILQKIILLLQSGNMINDIYNKYGTPKFDKKYLYNQLSDENNVHCLFVQISLFSPSYILLLLPSIILSIAKQYPVINNKLVSNLQNTIIKELIPTTMAQVNLYRAYLEILILFLYTVLLFTPSRSTLLTLIIIEYIMLKYTVSAYTRHVIAVLVEYIDIVLLHSKTPTILQNGYLWIKEKLNNRFSIQSMYKRAAHQQV